MAKFKAVSTTDSNLPSVALAEGQMILTSDEGNLYFDTDTERIQAGKKYLEDYIESLLTWKGVRDDGGYGSNNGTHSDTIVISSEGVHEIYVDLFIDASTASLMPLYIPGFGIGNDATFRHTTSWPATNDNYYSVTVRRDTATKTITVKLVGAYKGGGTKLTNPTWWVYYR